MNYVKDISRPKRNDKVALLIGSGPSVEKLKMSRLNAQSKYDICTLTDAIKLFDATRSVKYAINYHFQGLFRIRNHLHLAQYVLMPDHIMDFFLEKTLARQYNNMDVNLQRVDTVKKVIEGLKNIYYFQSVNLLEEDLEKRNFNKEFCNNTLYQAQGSVVGAFYFLASVMRYTQICYIGFDGSKEESTYEDFLYGSSIAHGRKHSKVRNAGKSYQRSWKNVNYMRDQYFPHVHFLPFNDREFLIRE